jgi:chromosome segregation ATPase
MALSDLTAEEKAQLEKEIRANLEKELRVKIEGEFTDKIENARKQEKDKLYKEIAKKDEEITSLKSKVEELSTSVSTKDKELADKISEYEKSIKSLEKKLEKAEKDGAAVSDKVMAEVNDKISALQKLIDDREAKLAAMEAQAEVDKYRATKIRELDESMHDLVFGATKEEVDATFTKAKASWDKIQEKMGKLGGSIGLPKAPFGITEEMRKELTPDQIKGIRDPKEWAETRKKLGLK